MRTRLLTGTMLAAAAVTATLALAAPAGAGTKDNATCMGRLGREAKGDMAVVTVDWRSDFIGLGTPGAYASHLGHSRPLECPPTP